MSTQTIRHIPESNGAEFCQNGKLVFEQTNHKRVIPVKKSVLLNAFLNFFQVNIFPDIYGFKGIFDEFCLFSIHKAIILFPTDIRQIPVHRSKIIAPQKDNEP
ncbi:MAG: hypothetical protein A2651_02775 [Candidatus Yanofskybacteria bacterium RIFCSPHIGHO2_01_FULL_42_12]|nr:MAG: hypothetical protein A2651_02775 [Candidatus Yanofskybacteria bacterium RIFCSPHIGHO2_01_FULL_42_12]